MWPTDDDESTEENEAPEDAMSSDESDDSSDEAPPGADDTSADPDDAAQPFDDPTPWTLPIRAAPILALQGEEVVEFPLSQHRNGLESTSLVMDEKLMRIVEARYDPDGVRRRFT